MAKKKKEDPAAETQPQPAEEETVVTSSKTWAEEFDNSDHMHYLRLAAESIQEAGNIAAKTGKVEDMLIVAQHWGELAVTKKNMDKGTAFGFGGREENE